MILEEKTKIEQVVKLQKDFFLTGKTRDISFRKEILKKLLIWLKNNQPLVEDALFQDLNKTPFEAYVTEIGMVMEEINTMIPKIAKYSKKQKAKSVISQFPSKNYIINEPYGITLIMSPWNYPFQLSLIPLVDAIAAGKCVILKPSSYANSVANILVKLVKECFSPEYVSIFLGGHEVNSCLLEQNLDYIFFTGSPKVGKIVMEAAAKNLTPVSLELGGKSPCIVDKTADIDLSAKRIIWGKGLNAGQTCVAPDYVLVQKEKYLEFVEACKKWIKYFWGEYSENNKQFPKIISDRHFERLQELVKGASFGGACVAETRKIEFSLFIDDLSNPTLLTKPVMEEEIFGPILPIIPFGSMDNAKNIILSKPKPLAFYLFTKSKKVEEDMLSSIPFGGGCINDTVVHLSNPNLPFGGVGNSGMGRYHGKFGFETFSHKKSILKKSCLIDLSFRYPPYTQKKLKITKHFLG